jgi:choline dehydrogenase
MQSGIGDQAELQRFGIPLLQHLPGVGQNFQDHPAFGCVWECVEALDARNTMCEATFFWRSKTGIDTPDLQTCQAEIPFSSAENAARFGMPASGWSLFGGVVRPKSRGRIRLTGPNPPDPVQIEANFLSHPDDLQAAIACVELCREIGNSTPLQPFVKREVMPGNLKGVELEDFVRNGIVTFWLQTCTAKMGRDSMSVVDGNLRVYGIDNLRIADGSIMPRVTTGNTMAPCVIIGERAQKSCRLHITLNSETPATVSRLTTVSLRRGKVTLSTLQDEAASSGHSADKDRMKRSWHLRYQKFLLARGRLSV